MPRRHTVTRTLAVSLAIAALAAPAALARSVDLRSPDAKDAAAHARITQDLRSPDAKDAAAHARTIQDLRSPDAKDAAAQSQGVQQSAAALAQERYYSSSVRPAPLERPARPGSADDGTPWVLIGLGLAAAALAAAGTAGAASRTRLRARRARVAA